MNDDWVQAVKPDGKNSQEVWHRMYSHTTIGWVQRKDSCSTWVAGLLHSGTQVANLSPYTQLEDAFRHIDIFWCEILEQEKETKVEAALARD